MAERVQIGAPTSAAAAQVEVVLDRIGVTSAVLAGLAFGPTG